jgi:predicted enzyme related to lactoylglutathione lyase
MNFKRSFMAINRTLFVPLVAAICFVSCTQHVKTDSDGTADEASAQTQTKPMKSYISLFEIPATDVSRAIAFYQALLDITIEKMDIEGTPIGVFPYEEHLVHGVIIQADGYKPSSDGVTLYLNAGDALQPVLDRVTKNGGQILVPKTAHADGSGYFAIFLDTEGNRMALNARN